MFRSNIKQVHCSGVAAECIYEEYRSSDIFQDLVNSVTGGPSLVLGRRRGRDIFQDLVNSVTIDRC